MHIPGESLWVTIFETDDEAEEMLLVIDGKVKLSGRTASEAELTAILTSALASEDSNA